MRTHVESRDCWCRPKVERPEYSPLTDKTPTKQLRAFAAKMEREARDTGWRLLCAQKRLERIERAGRAVIRKFEKFDEPPSRQLTQLCKLFGKGD